MATMQHSYEKVQPKSEYYAIGSIAIDEMIIGKSCSLANLLLPVRGGGPDIPANTEVPPMTPHHLL